MKRFYLTVVVSLLMALGVGVGLAESGNDLFRRALVKERSEENVEQAIQLYQRIVREFSGDRALAAKALLQMGRSYEKLGKAKDAQQAYERIVGEYTDQPETLRVARDRLATLAKPSVPIDGPRVTVRMVWAGPRANTLGQPSLDGRYLSFTDWETGDLAVRDLASGRNRRLTNKGSWRDSAEYAHFSTISPDGRQVAYAWFNNKKFYELRIISIEGSKPPARYPNLDVGFVRPTAPPSDRTPTRQPSRYFERDDLSPVLGASEPRVLYRNEEVQFIKPSAWSADGKYILALFFGKSILNQIVLISVADGSVRVLKSPFWIYPKKMSLSPDGRYIVYGLDQQPPYLERDIFLISTDGSHEIRLVEHPANDLFPVWAPDGKSVLFASTRTGTLDAWVIPVAGGKPRGSPRLVKRDIGRFLPLGFTRNGALYYGLRAGTEDAYVASLDLPTGELLESPRPVSPRFAGLNRSPDWSPDGEQLAYLTHVGTENQGLEFRTITIRSCKTGQERQLTEKLGYLEWLRWSPDGRSFLVGGSDTRNLGGLYQVDAQTSDVTAIVQGEFAPPQGHEGVWSADGEAIFYVHEDMRKRSTSIRFRDLESGQEKKLYHVATPWRVNNLALSPDGELLAFGLSKGNRNQAEILLVMPAAGGKPSELLRLPKAGLSGVAWSRDGSQLLFSRSAEPTPELWRIPSEGGEPRRLGLKTNENARISLHPDGRQIAFTAGKTNTEIWVMENFLPEPQAAR